MKSRHLANKVTASHATVSYTHLDVYKRQPHAFALFSELPRPLCRNGNCPSPHLQIWKSIPVPPERPIPPPAHKPRRTTPAQQIKGISSSGIQGCAFKLTYGNSRDCLLYTSVPLPGKRELPACLLAYPEKTIRSIPEKRPSGFLQYGK